MWNANMDAPMTKTRPSENVASSNHHHNDDAVAIELPGAVAPGALMILALQERGVTPREAAAEAGTAYPNNHRTIKTLLQTLKEAQDIREVGHGQPHPLKGPWRGRLAISVGKGLRVVLEPGPDDPQHRSKAVNWKTVRQVRIIEIADYH